MQRKSTFGWVVIVIAVILLFTLNLSLGSAPIPIKEIFKIILGIESSKPVWSEIVWNFRLTKALTCALVGAGLAVGGLQMQTLFRNPLAGPDVLGLSSGASLAVSLVFMSNAAGFTLINVQNGWSVAVAASIGCAAIFAVMLIVSRKVADNVSLLIVGLMVGAGASSIVSVLQYLSSADEMQVYIIWTFGSLGGLNWTEIKILALVLLFGSGIATANMKALNAWLLGDNYATSVGIALQRSRLLIILSTSLLTGAVTAFCGPIAFVGLAVPQLVKVLIKTQDHKILLPAVFLGGAALVLGCDIVSQLPGGANVLPINTITALVGAPVVIWVILRNKAVR